MPTEPLLAHARRQGGQGQSTQVGRQRLGIELIPAYSPEARGRSERMFGTLQKRLPQEPAPASPRSTRPTASSRRSPQHNALRHRRGRVPFAGALTISSASRRSASLDLRRLLQRPPSPPLSRPRSGCTSIPTARSPSSTMAALQGRRRAHRARVIRFDATGRSPVDKWTAAQRLTTSPQAQQHQPKRSTHMVHKPVSSECSRHAAPRFLPHRVRET